MKLYHTQANIERPPFLGGGLWTLTGLRALTVLFGKNGSGKSLLLRNWRNASASEFHYVVPERAGEFGFNINYMQGELDPDQRRNQSQQNYTPEYRQRTFARIQAYYNARGARRSGELIGPSPDELESLIAILFPDFRVELHEGFPPYRIIRSEGDANIDGANQLSSGEAQFLSLGVDIVTVGALWELRDTQKRILLVDEPDAHIHPDLQVRFADFLLRVAERFRMQVAVATHSTTLLAALGQFAKEDAGVVYMRRGTAQFAAQPFTDALKELSAVLGGHALMGPLFGAPLLLVEGDDDYRVWSQVPRHHHTAFAVIPCDGDKIQQYQRSLERVLGSLRDGAARPSGFALLDGDKPIPQRGNPPQDHVQFIGLGCHETENLYLTDEVLQSLGTTWEAARTTIVQAAPRFGQKQALLEQAPNWDRQRADIKEVIGEVATILDPKRAHWTSRVGTTLGKARPAGTLATFLGHSVVQSLWPPIA